MKTYFCLVLMALLTISGYAQTYEEANNLESAIGLLRKKTIWEAYFEFQAPGVPMGSIFMPDTKGGAYIIVGKELNLGKEAKPDPNGFKNWDPKKGRTPTLDVEKRKIILYSDSQWHELKRVMRSYLASDATISTLRISSQFEPSTQLVIEIPKENLPSFLKKLVEESWGVPMATFEYKIGWN